MIIAPNAQRSCVREVQKTSAKIEAKRVIETEWKLCHKSIWVDVKSIGIESYITGVMCIYLYVFKNTLSLSLSLSLIYTLHQYTLGIRKTKWIILWAKLMTPEVLLQKIYQQLSKRKREKEKIDFVAEFIHFSYSDLVFLRPNIFFVIWRADLLEIRLVFCMTTHIFTRSSWYLTSIFCILKRWWWFQ